ncbi:unnamed protein product [Meloidogyne enterolobii]|uniref:Uncharacterized protein n=1 Tax=Meloidogyne enterolobii TaxID=390850 RepID=A0ACB1ANQ4_MELEN
MPTPVQKYTIRILTESEENDLITVANTGSGKLAYFIFNHKLNYIFKQK